MGAFFTLFLWNGEYKYTCKIMLIQPNIKQDFPQELYCEAPRTKHGGILLLGNVSLSFTTWKTKNQIKTMQKAHLR